MVVELGCRRVLGANASPGVWCARRAGVGGLYWSVS